MFKSIKNRLLFYFLAIGLIPVIVTGIASLLQSREALRNQAFSQLISVRENKKAQLDVLLREKERDMLVLQDIVATFKQNAFQKLRSVLENKKLQIEGYFDGHLSEIGVLSENNSLAEALEQFDGAFMMEGNQTGGRAWRSIADKFGAELIHFQEARGYQDLLLISLRGDVVYSARQAADLGQNVADGPLKESVLGRAFQQGLKGAIIQDYAPYAPQEGRYMAFLAAPVHRHGELIGVLALELSHEPINRIVQPRKGMGETGETYVIGEAGGQTSYRSDRTVKKTAANRIGRPKKGRDIDKALAGESGVAMKGGSTNVPELGAYAPLNIPGLHWCILTTIALEEVIVPKLTGAGADFFSQYIKAYDYYDLFLINPKGDIFYTVEHEADYGTNLHSGEFKDSELGKLFREVMTSKTFGISDYAPYGPSGGAPALFGARPLLNEAGEVELVIVLQLSEKMFNEITQQRAGMGESGEIYLVGGKKRMRSDSFLDPDKHSIRASFLDPARGSVDTESSRAALAGGSGTHEIENYLGDQVISTYAPLRVGNRTWALIAEIHVTEAFAHIRPLQWLVAIIAALVALISVIVIGRFTKKLVEPLLLVKDHLRNLAQGRLSEEDIAYRDVDEISEIIVSFRQLRQSVKSTIKQANAIAAGDYSREVELLSEEDQLGKALAGMTGTLRGVIDQANAIAAGDYSQKITLLSDRDRLGRALSEMTRILQENTVKNSREDWLKSGHAQLSERISGEQDRKQLAENVIDFLTPYVGARAGVFYLLEEERHLKIFASHAYLSRKNTANTFQLGEGIVGQAGFEQKMFVVTKAPEEYIPSEQGESAPGAIAVIPFLYENTLKGVIELASVDRFSETQLEFLKQAMPAIAIAVNTAESRTKMQTLLEEK